MNGRMSLIGHNAAPATYATVCPQLAKADAASYPHHAARTPRDSTGLDAHTVHSGHPRWRRRAPLARSSPSHRPAVLGAVGCPGGLFCLASFGGFALLVGARTLLRLGDLFPVFLQCAAVALLNRLPPSGPGPGGLNNRGFSTIARAICCDETGAVVTGHSNADSCTSLDRALRGANAVRV
jgi:hypothetical protein